MTERPNRPSGAAPHRPRTGLFKSERPTDKALLWRVGTWGGVALASLIGAILLARSPIAARHTALNDAHVVIAAQARQLQHLIQQNDSETRRLAAAMNTLNSDRDRLYQRVTELERNLDTVTGSVTKLAARPVPAPPPAIGAPQSVPVTIRLPAISPASLFAPDGVSMAAERSARPDMTASIAPKPVATPPAAKSAPLPAIPEKKVSAPAAGKLPLGIDLGSANSIEGLRAIWDQTRKAYPDEVGDLQPVIAVQEPKNGVGLQLRLVAGPVPDAQGIEKRCAPLIEATRPCASASFDGQRLATRDARVKPAPKQPPRAARSEPRAAPASRPRSLLPNFLGGG